MSERCRTEFKAIRSTTNGRPSGTYPEPSQIETLQRQQSVRDVAVEDATVGIDGVDVFVQACVIGAPVVIGRCIVVCIVLLNVFGGCPRRGVGRALLWWNTKIRPKFVRHFRARARNVYGLALMTDPIPKRFGNSKGCECFAGAGAVDQEQRMVRGQWRKKGADELLVVLESDEWRGLRVGMGMCLGMCL